MKNKRYDKASEIYRNLETLLLECHEIGGCDEYPDIIDGLTRVLKSVNMVKIKSIKGVDTEKNN